MIEAVAPAKINLALHVTGKRDDGYHSLDSLVAFARAGDRISVGLSDNLSLTVGGPFRFAVPANENNLILQAARLFGTNKNARIELEKNLPVASGIGGGSSDAAAAIRSLAEFWKMPLPDHAAQLSIGADVPVCLFGETTRMRGIGDKIEPVSMPSFSAVLVNPGIAVSTPEVFAGLRKKTNPELEILPETNRLDVWLDYLCSQRNDLEEPAIEFAPEIMNTLDCLSVQQGCGLARMSGSGATCFGLFTSQEMAKAASVQIKRDQPDWWVTQTWLG